MDKISPMTAARQSIKTVVESSRRFGLLIPVLIGICYLEDSIPPDPFIRIFYGVPLELLSAPFFVFLLQVFLFDKEQAPGVFSKQFFKTSVLFFLYSIAFSIASNLIGPLSALIAMPVVGGIMGGGSAYFEITVKVAMAILAIAVLYVFLRLGLIFPAIVDGIRRPLSMSWRLMSGYVIRFVLSFVVVSIPVLAVTFLGEFALSSIPTAAQDSQFDWISIFWKAFIGSLLWLIGFSLVCIWYKQLRTRHGFEEGDENVVPEAPVPSQD